MKGKIILACAGLLLVGLAVGFLASRQGVELGAAGSATGRELRQKNFKDFVGTPSALATLTSAYSGASSTYDVRFLGNMHLEVSFMPTTTGQYLQLRVETSNDGGTTFYPLAVKNITTSTIDINTTHATDGVPLSWFQGISTATGTVYYLADDYNIVADVVRVSARCNTGNDCVAHVRGTFATN